MTSKMTKQLVSAGKEYSRQQSKSDSHDNELSDDFPNESTTSTSTYELTNSLKRPLSNGVDSDKNKKIRLTDTENKPDPLLKFENIMEYLTNNTDETETITSSTDNSINDDSSNSSDQDLEVIDSDTSFDISLSDLPEDISDILNGEHKITEDNCLQLLRFFSKKNLSDEQFDSYLTKQIIGILMRKLEMSKYHSILEFLCKREKYWQSKYSSLKRQFEEIKTLINVYKLNLKNNEHAIPQPSTSSVCLQAGPSKEHRVQLPKLATPLSKPDNNTVIIVDVDDDDNDNVIILDTVKSVGSSTSKIAKTKTKKQILPSVNIAKLARISSNSVTTSPKTVTAAKSMNPINIGIIAIDLTESDDEIEELNIINLEDTTSPN